MQTGKPTKSAKRHRKQAPAALQAPAPVPPPAGPELLCPLRPGRCACSRDCAWSVVEVEDAGAPEEREIGGRCALVQIAIELYALHQAR